MHRNELYELTTEINTEMFLTLFISLSSAHFAACGTFDDDEDDDDDDAGAHLSATPSWDITNLHGSTLTADNVSVTDSDESEQAEDPPPSQANNYQHSHIGKKWVVEAARTQVAMTTVAACSYWDLPAPENQRSSNK